MLRALHSVPAARAAQLLGCEPSTEAWRTRHAQFRDLMEQALLPQLDTQLGAVISQHYAQFLDDPLDFTPCFVHCDLGAEHILVDPQTRRPAGLIDFDWSAVGDPAIDFVGMLTTLGPAATREAVTSDEANISWERLLFYWWRSTVHPVPAAQTTVKVTNTTGSPQPYIVTVKRQRLQRHSRRSDSRSH